MTTFNELFYRFSIWDKDPKTKINPDGHRQCKLCLEHTDKPLKVHTAIHCTVLKPHRRAFCQNMHTALGKIYKKGVWVHQQDYAQTVLQTLHNIATNQNPPEQDKERLWKITCGSDGVKVDRCHRTGVTTCDLQYTDNTAKRGEQRLFWEETRAWSGKYLYAIERCWKAKNPRNNIKTKWKTWRFEECVRRGTNFNYRRLHWNCVFFSLALCINVFNASNSIIQLSIVAASLTDPCEKIEFNSVEYLLHIDGLCEKSKTRNADLRDQVNPATHSCSLFAFKIHQTPSDLHFFTHKTDLHLMHKIDKGSHTRQTRSVMRTA